MSRIDDKRQLRETKRELKRAGRKKVRARAKQILGTDPDIAHLVEDHYGRYATSHLNGMDRDATRRAAWAAHHQPGPEEAEPEDDEP